MQHLDEKVVSIDIVFENCEFVSIPIELVKNLVISDITKTMLINCFQYKGGNTMVYTYCGTLYFYLDYRLANEPIKTNFSEYMDTVTYSQRLSRGDITSIELVYNSDRKEEYHISWSGDSDYFDSNQKVVLDDNLFLVKIIKPTTI